MFCSDKKRDGEAVSFLLHFLLSAREAEVSRALEGEFACISLDEQPILRAVDGHFHPVAAFKLKGHKVLAIVVETDRFSAPALPWTQMFPQLY